MKLLSCCILAAILFGFSTTQLKAQCTTAALNWDALDFLQEGTNVSNAIATNQKFAFGKDMLTITHNYSMANALGDNTTNTAETGSYGAGTDVQFKGNGTITLTFASPVQNVQFSMYDIDFGQKATITALNGATAQNVSIATIGTSNVIVTGTGTTIATAYSDSLV
ncbi:MAG TPA: hypothetical protein VM187_14880, partial [Niastella sp.]|nr:hypothetical protein [Niastella sp.]